MKKTNQKKKMTKTWKMTMKMTNHENNNNDNTVKTKTTRGDRNKTKYSVGVMIATMIILSCSAWEFRASGSSAKTDFEAWRLRDLEDPKTTTTQPRALEGPAEYLLIYHYNLSSFI